MPTIRSPICSVLGHVDHGKSSILDSVRGTCIVATEAGKITQAIGASIIPLDVIKAKCGDLLKQLNLKFTIPGLLFIDTPGHAAFTTLRKRGGNLADIAILVVDINEGFKPQTEEAIEILKNYKTPFIVAANKVDLISGWKSMQAPILKTLSEQRPETLKIFETKLYSLVSQFFEKYKMEAERFDRVSDFTKQIAIVPCSAKTCEGIAELLMVVTGLAQKYLEESLKTDTEGNAKGTILEVKEEKGMGMCLDVIIYDGNLKVNDTIVIGSVEKPIVTKVRALFEPMPLAEMMDRKSKFRSVKQLSAATGVKISAPNIEGAVAGMPLRSCSANEVEKVKEELEKEVEEVVIETEKTGIVIKADSLGSLEALITLLKEKKIPIRKASVGNITKKDISDAESNYEEDPLQSVILGFNVKPEAEVSGERVTILTNNIIYRLIEDFEQWRKEEKRRQEEKELDKLVRPCKLEIMRGYVFRQSNPAIVGTEVLKGKLNSGIPVMDSKGKTIAKIKSIEKENETLSSAEKGLQVAVAYEGAIVGRQIKEGDFVYSATPEEDFRKMKKFKKYLREDEIDVLKEIAKIMRERYPVWGV